MPCAAAAQPNDPIFAIIERCRMASMEFTAASIANDGVAAKLRGQPIAQADQDRYEAAANELDEASGCSLPRHLPRWLVFLPPCHGSWNTMRGASPRLLTIFCGLWPRRPLWWEARLWRRLMSFLSQVSPNVSVMPMTRYSASWRRPDVVLQRSGHPGRRRLNAQVESGTAAKPLGQLVRRTVARSRTPSRRPSHPRPRL